MTRARLCLLAAAALTVASSVAPVPARAEETDPTKKKVLGKIDSFDDAFKNAQDLDPAQAVSVKDLTLEYDSMKLVLSQGTVVPRQTIEGQVFSAVFVGTGRFTFTAPDKTEADELEYYAGERSLDKEVDAAFFYFDSDLWDRVKASGQAGAPDKKVLAEATRVWKQRKGVTSNAGGLDEYSALGLTVVIDLAGNPPLLPGMRVDVFLRPEATALQPPSDTKAN